MININRFYISTLLHILINYISQLFLIAIEWIKMLLDSFKSILDIFSNFYFLRSEKKLDFIEKFYEITIKVLKQSATKNISYTVIHNIRSFFTKKMIKVVSAFFGTEEVTF